MNDGKRDSGHLRSLGFAPMPRSEFNALMAKASSEPGQGQWAVDESIDVSQWNPQAARV